MSRLFVPAILSAFKGASPSDQGVAHQHRVIRLPDAREEAASTKRPGQVRGRLVQQLAEFRELSELVIVLLLAGDERREIAASRVIHVMSGRAKRRGPSPATRAALLLAMLLSPRLATAQTLRVATPTELFDPENSSGVKLGEVLVLRNETTLQAQSDSNIYNVDIGKTADTLGMIKSDFSLGTTSSRHMAELSVGGTLQRYARTSAEDTSTYHGAAKTRLDLGERITVEADGELTHDYEMRGTAGDQFTSDHPVLYNKRQVHARVGRSGGILEVAVEGSWRTQDYLNTSAQGVPIDLSYRNATVRQGALEAQYRLSPALRFYSEVSANQVVYAQNLGYARNSSGYAALAGLHIAVSSVVDMEVAAGYLRQSFQSAASAPASGINYKLAASWTPTPVWRLTAGGRRDVDASPLLNVPAIVRSTFDLKAQRAIGDRTLVETNASFTQEDYRGIPRADRRVEASATVHYRVMRNIGLLAQAGYRKQWGGASGRTYKGFSGSVGVRIVV